MIVGELKDLSDIMGMIKGYNRILVVGCGGCVTVCQTGGAQEAEILAGLLVMGNPDVKVNSLTVSRQCEWEFLDQISSVIKEHEVIVSIACGIGVQAMNEHFKDLQTVPALNTQFLGMPVEHGVFVERCQLVEIVFCT